MHSHKGGMRFVRTYSSGQSGPLSVLSLTPALKKTHIALKPPIALKRRELLSNIPGVLTRGLQVGRDYTTERAGGFLPRRILAGTTTEQAVSNGASLLDRPSLRMRATAVVPFGL